MTPKRIGEFAGVPFAPLPAPPKGILRSNKSTKLAQDGGSC